MSDDNIDDDGPVDFDAELNDFSIGDDAPPPVPNSTPRTKRRVIINEDDNTTHDVPAAGKKKNSLPLAVRNMNNYKPIEPTSNEPNLESLPSDTSAPTAGDDESAKQEIVYQIEQLKKQLYVEGSGMRPTRFNTMQQLLDERDLCNNQVNTRRGHGAIKGAVLALTPFIEKIITRVVPQEQFDVSSHYHLKDEVKESWGMFEEAMTQIAILHAKWFAVSPYAEVAQCMFACADSCDKKNQAIRRAEKSPTASAPNTPAYATTSSQDDDNGVEEMV